MFAVFVVLVLQVYRLQEAIRLVDHVTEVNVRSEACLNLVTQMDASLRAYLMTGQPLRLDLCNDTSKAVHASFARLDEIVRDNPDEAKQVDAIRPEYHRWAGTARDQIALRASGADYAAILSRRPAQPQLDSLVARLQALKWYERRLRTGRDEGARAAARNTIWLAGLATLLGGLGLAGAAYCRLTGLSRAYDQAIENERSSSAKLAETLEDRDRQLAEQARAQRTILNTAPIGILISHDRECRFMDGNNLVREFYKMPPGANISKTAPPEKAEATFTMFDDDGRELTGDQLPMQLSASTGLPHDRPVRVRRIDGTEIWVHISAAPILDDEGEVYGSVGCVEDVTQRKEMEEALRERDRRIALAQEVAGFVAWDWDILGDRMVWLEDTTPVLGRPRDELPSGFLPLGDLVHPDDRAARQAAMARALAGSGDFLTEYRIVLPDGSIRWVSSRGRVTERSNGKPSRMAGVTFDVTERKQLEARALEAQRLESVGKLAGGIAHEFNNMLTVISGHAELLGLGLPPDSPLAAGAGQIGQAASRAADLTSQLLSFARKQMVRSEPLDLNSLVLGLQTVLRHLLGEKVQVTMLPDADLRLVRADRGQIEQVLINLALNARDAMPDGGRIIVETRSVKLGDDYNLLRPDVAPGDYALLAVTDTGCGMDEATARRAFEPFFTTKEVGKGTGLGLATCYGIVKQAGGQLSLYTEPGKGSTFKIYLPVLSGAAPQAPPLPAQPGMPSGTGTVLVTEDEETVRILASDCLSSLGYNVLQAADGEDALRVAEGFDGKIDLLLSDVVMPRLGGKELADRLLKLRPDMKTVLMSGYPSGALQTAGELPGSLLFLQKPFTPSALAQRVREALKS
jgi:signal transduction histidine kinase/CheY-like chemotaxis protein/CHASE3 domain sensor protein